MLFNDSMTIYKLLLEDFCFEVPTILEIPYKLRKANLHLSPSIFVIFWKYHSFKAG